MGELPEMELTEERAKVMAMLDQASTDLIDVDKMVKDQKKAARDDIKYWQQKIRKSKKEMKKAKKNKKKGLKKIRQLVRKCKGKGLKPLSDNKWNTSKDCKAIRDCNFAKNKKKLLEEELLQEEQEARQR